MMFVSSVDAALITSAASLTSYSERSFPPAIESRIPLRADQLCVDERGAQRALRGLDGAILAGREADPHQRRARALHDRADVGEIDVDQPGLGDQVADSLHALPQHVVRDLEGVEHRRALVEHLEEALVRDHDHRVAGLAERVDARLRLRSALRALEAERHGHDADGQRADLARDAGDDRGCARAGPPALAGGDEDHVRAAKRPLDLVVGLLGCAAADVRLRAGAEAARELAPDVDLHLGVAERELLEIGVDGDELDGGDARVDHPVDRVQPGAADTHDLDVREVRGVGARSAMQPRRRLGQRLEQPRDPAVRRRLAGLDGLGRPGPGRGRRHPRRGAQARLPVLRLGCDLELGRRMLDRLLERLARDGPSFLLGLLLRGFRCPEELGERALTHACALSRH